MSNIYWSVYKNLEKGVVNLSYSIHIDDNQLNVYSSYISDLILRASAEIESISKELYKLNGGSKTIKIKYDTDALEYLNNLWKLDLKVVILSSINCFQTNKELKPFLKNEISTFHGKQTYSWNNSYQNLKHDRANTLQYGSVKYLIDIMASLYVLNIYYKNESILLYKDGNAINFPINMGSELFSVKLHKWFSYDGNHNYGKKDFFDECLYYVKYTEESLQKNKDAFIKVNEDMREHFKKHPKLLEYLQNNKLEDYHGNNLMYDVLGKEEYRRMIEMTTRDQREITKNSDWEATLNKNII